MSYHSIAVSYPYIFTLPPQFSLIENKKSMIFIQKQLYLYRSGCQPTVVECEGDYQYDKRKNCLQWNVSVVDKSNAAGSMEFSCPSSIPADFFPLDITFVSKQTYADIKVKHVTKVDDDTIVPFSVETVFYPEKYEIA